MRGVVFQRGRGPRRRSVRRRGEATPPLWKFLWVNRCGVIRRRDVEGRARRRARFRLRSRESSLSQEPLGTGQNLTETLVARNGETQRASERFENGFDLMVRGAAVERAKMNVGLRALREAL